MKSSYAVSKEENINLLHGRVAMLLSILPSGTVYVHGNAYHTIASNACVLFGFPYEPQSFLWPHSIEVLPNYHMYIVNTYIFKHKTKNNAELSVMVFCNSNHWQYQRNFFSLCPLPMIQVLTIYCSCAVINFIKM